MFNRNDGAFVGQILREGVQQLGRCDQYLFTAGLNQIKPGLYPGLTLRRLEIVVEGHRPHPLIPEVPGELCLSLVRHSGHDNFGLKLSDKGGSYLNRKLGVAVFEQLFTQTLREFTVEDGDLIRFRKETGGRAKGDHMPADTSGIKLRKHLTKGSAITIVVGNKQDIRCLDFGNGCRALRQSGLLLGKLAAASHTKQRKQHYQAKDRPKFSVGVGVKAAGDTFPPSLPYDLRYYQ